MNKDAEPSASRKEFLSELKERYKEDIAWKSGLDNKADKMITMSSAVSTLLIGIGTFLISRIEPTTWLYNLDIGILMMGVILAACAIGLFIYSFRVRDFYYPFGPSDFYFSKVTKSDKTADPDDAPITRENIENIHNRKLTPQNIREFLNESEVEKRWGFSKTEFTERAIKLYLEVMKLNSEILYNKASYLALGQWLFLGSILSVSLLLGITLVGISSGITFIEEKSIKNELPISNAGNDREVIENKTIVLDGSQSRDRDGTIRSYDWKQLSGYKVDILNKNEVSAEFTAPNVMNATQLEFKLVVTDDKDGTSDDTVRVIVKNDTLQDPSNPIVCSGVVPYSISDRLMKPDYREMVSNTSDTQCEIGTRRGGFEGIPSPFFAEATNK